MISNRERMLRQAALPALLWLALKVILSIRTEAPALLHSLTDLLPILFAIDWFRFVLGRGHTGPSPLRRKKWRLPRLLAVIIRAGTMILLSTAILLPPTWLIAFLALVVFDQTPNPDVVPQVVAFALPIAVTLASPLLVRFYVYYAAVFAGREDVRARDVWRWSRGKGVRLVALIAASLAPGFIMITLAETLPSDSLSMIAGYAAAGLVLFPSMAVMATATARSMAGLLIPPVWAD